MKKYLPNTGDTTHHPELNGDHLHLVNYTESLKQGQGWGILLILTLSIRGNAQATLRPSIMEEVADQDSTGH